ncbi:MAG: hypothetical protein ACR2G7_12780 [Acidimicrobiales bacterium]
MSGQEWIYDEDELAAIDAWSAQPSSRPPDSGVAGLRRRSAGGALAAAVMLGLRDVLEPPPDDDEAVVSESPGEPDDPTAGVILRFDPESPQATFVILRHEET